MPRRERPQPSFMHYLEGEGPDQPLQTIIFGHLVIESLLVHLIDASPETPSSYDAYGKLNFPGKVDRCIELGHLTLSVRHLYLKLNELRNKFAHRLGHRVTPVEVFDFVQSMALECPPYDFSDDGIHQDLEYANEAYGIDGMLIEILNNFFLELSLRLIDIGGPDFTG